MSYSTSPQLNGSTPTATTPPPPKRKGLRPESITPEAAAAVTQTIAVGASRTIAAQAAGITPSTLNAWLRKGRNQARGPYRDLRKAVLQAHGQAKLERLALVRAAGEAGDWKAAAWWLERMCQEEFGDQRLAIAEIKRGQREIMDYIKKSNDATQRNGLH